MSGALFQVIKHSQALNLDQDDHPGHPWLDGRSGGQSLYGDTQASGDLKLLSTYHGTKGKVVLGAVGTSYFNEVDSTLAIAGTISAATPTSGSHLVTKDYVDALTQGLEYQESVLDRTTNALAVETLGNRYISTETSGAWTIHYIYEWNGASWDETIPNEGYACWVEDEDVLYVFNATSWVKFGATITHGNLLALNQDDHSGHPWLGGRSGGQVLIGDTDSAGTLRLQSTSHGTKGIVYIGSGTIFSFDETNTAFQVKAVAGSAKITVDAGPLTTDDPVYELAQNGTVYRIMGYDRSTSTFVIGTTDVITGTHFQLNNAGVVKLTSLSVNQAVFTNGSKQLVSNAITGSGNVVMSASPTLTGTVNAAAITLTGTISALELSLTGDMTVTKTGSWSMYVDASSNAEVILDRGQVTDTAGVKLLMGGNDEWAFGTGYSSSGSDFNVRWIGVSPLSVFTISSGGHVTFVSAANIKCAVDNSYMDFYGGTGSATGARMRLAGSGYSNASEIVFYQGATANIRFRISPTNEHTHNISDTLINAFRIAGTTGTPAYFMIDNNATPKTIYFGNTTDNTAYSFLGTGPMTIGGIIAGVADYDKFVVSDGGTLKFRTGAEVLSDIGAGLSIGSSVSGSTNNCILYVNGSGNLANDAPFVYNGSSVFSIGKSTFSGWDVAFAALQIGSTCTIFSDIAAASGKGAVITHNAYRDGGVYKRILSDLTSRYLLYNGTHIFTVAGTGAADSNISWTTAMTIDNSGNVQVRPDDNNGVCTFGSVKIGSAGSDEGVFSHIDKFTVSNYALKQDSAGNTFVNGQNELYLKISGATYLGCNSNKITLQKLLITDNISMEKAAEETWATNVTRLQMGGNGTFNCTTAEQVGAILAIMENAYKATSNDVYISSDWATKYRQDNGAHTFEVSSISGTAGNPITWVTSMIITNTGQIQMINQNGVTAAVLQLQQLDVDEPFFKVIGTAASTNLTRSIVDVGDVTTFTPAGYIKVEVQDDGEQITDQDYFIEVGTIV